MSNIRNEAVQIESHRLYLKSLAEREQYSAYQRSDYLANEWQEKLLRKNRSSLECTARCSPQSVMSSQNAQSGISTIWRERICEWQYGVVDRFDIEREVVFYSTYYLDQYLSVCYVDEKLFQLVAMTCFYLAIKLHSPKKLGIQCIASMGRGVIHEDHIAAMELSIMQNLDWYLHPPTPLAFIRNIFPLISDKHEAQEFCQFLSELSVCAYPFVYTKPSSIAIAAILIAIDRFQLGNETRVSCRELLEELELDIYAPDVSQCCNLLTRIYRLAAPELESSNCCDTNISAHDSFIGITNE